MNSSTNDEDVLSPDSMQSPAFIKARIRRKSKRLLERKSITASDIDFLATPSSLSMGINNRKHGYMSQDDLNLLSETRLLTTDSPGLDDMHSPDSKRNLFSMVTPLKHSRRQEPSSAFMSPTTRSAENLSEEMRLFLNVRDDLLSNVPDSPLVNTKQHSNNGRNLDLISESHQEGALFFPVTPIKSSNGTKSANAEIKSHIPNFQLNETSNTATNQLNNSQKSSLELIRKRKKEEHLSLLLREKNAKIDNEVEKILGKARINNEKRKTESSKKRKREDLFEESQIKRQKPGLENATNDNSLSSLNVVLKTPSKIPRFSSPNVNKCHVSGPSPKITTAVTPCKLVGRTISPFKISTSTFPPLSPRLSIDNRLLSGSNRFGFKASLSSPHAGSNNFQVPKVRPGVALKSTAVVPQGTHSSKYIALTKSRRSSRLFDHNYS